jgi:hypothetical protein
MTLFKHGKDDGIDNLFNYILPLLFLVIVIVIAVKPSNECSNENKIKEKVLIGIIKHKYLDSNNHYTKTIIVSGTQKIYFYNNEKSKFYNYAHIGDSLYKPKGSLEVHVFRNDKDTVFNISYGCNK